MKTKTISGHYDTAYSIEHNNRAFVPKNVDADRIHWNYMCVAAGEESWFDFNDPICAYEFWARYRELSDLYWQNRSIANILAWEKYQEHLRYMRMFRRALYYIPDSGIAGFVSLLLLPLMIPCGIILTLEQERAREEFEAAKCEQWLLDLEFKAEKTALRTALYEGDRENGTQYLHMMDSVVREMAVHAQNYASVAQPVAMQPECLPQYATLEQIYDKLYEPSFRDFQSRQRPCRRYNGTYLEQIREGQRQATQRKQQSKNARSRTTAEAIEIVFGIGDMDNTGYVNAFDDAKASEALLKDYCDHLLMQPNMCYVTTKELDDPDWKPPFNHGLIILNLTVHCDEATPGVHLTCIPYSRDCKRGPAVQAALGRAMTGMGYPSTWRDVLNENGQRIPKRDKSGETVYNQDGSIRYQQEPDKQGIIDWIEDQKQWLQQEMLRRYGWRREYKGSHPRGNLATPDYQVARAKERYSEIMQIINTNLEDHKSQISSLSNSLHSDVKMLFNDVSTFNFLCHYLRLCPEQRYKDLLREAANFFSRLPDAEMHKAISTLQRKISDANKRAAELSDKSSKTTYQTTKSQRQ